MKYLLLAAAITTAPSLAAEQAQQFDLICTAKKDVTRYRIDLMRAEWCEGSCQAVRKIAEVSSGMLILEQHEPQTSRDRKSRTWINRSSGEWAAYSYDPKFDTTGSLAKGKCLPAAFTGFPANKF